MNQTNNFLSLLDSEQTIENLKTILTSKNDILKDQKINITAHLLKTILNNKHNFYKKIPNEDGKTTLKTSGPLKSIQDAIKENILTTQKTPYFIYSYTKGKCTKKNAEVHQSQKLIINLDISNFFNSISAKYVFKLFLILFQLDENIAKLLTELVTLDNYMPIGTSCSPFIANLIFFRHEEDLVKKLRSQGIIYTRFGDDITLSSSYSLTKVQNTNLICQVRKMVTKYGLKLNTKKQKIQALGFKQVINKQIVTPNKVTKGKDYKNLIRDEVHRYSSLNPSNKTEIISLYNKCVKNKKYKHKKNKLTMLEAIFNSINGKIYSALRYYPNKKSDSYEKLLIKLKNSRQRHIVSPK